MKTTPALPTTLARIREQRAMSQADLAAAIGVSQAQIHRIETRKNTLKPEHAKRAANALNCHWLELMEETPRFTPQEEIMLAHFRRLSEADRNRWVEMVGQADMARAAILTGFLRGLSAEDRKVLAAWAEMIAAIHSQS